MNQIKKFQTTPGVKKLVGKKQQGGNFSPSTNKPFYYGMPLKGSDTYFRDPVTNASWRQDVYQAENGHNYYVSTTEDPSTGHRTISESGVVPLAGLGYLRGVNVNVENTYDQNGNLVQPGDTTYYAPSLVPGFYRRDVDKSMYPQITEDINTYVDEIRTTPQPNKYTQRNTLPEKRQGGYLSLQKQGGKLTEVWTPFN